MQYLIRADASADIGSGHVMRCLTLACTLRQEGHSVHFVCRDLPGGLVSLIRRQGFPATLLPAPTAAQAAAAARQPETHRHSHWLPVPQREDAADTAAALSFRPDWIILDHYALAAPWQRILRRACPDARLLVIDDLADRPHLADILLDQTYGRRPEDYTALLPADCTVLAGTRYALLRPEFSERRTGSLKRRSLPMPAVRRLLVALGGVDKDNRTAEVLHALADWHRQPERHFAVEADIVMGAAAPHAEAVRRLAAEMPFACRVFQGTGNMAGLTAEADIAIGAAGGSAWERCCLGLPAVLLVLADNQRFVAESLRRAGAAFVLPTADLAARGSSAPLARLLKQPEAHWQAAARAAAALADGLGTGRLVRHLAAPLSVSILPGQPESRCALRSVSESDLETLRRWRNHPDIRCRMFDQNHITAEGQRRWFARKSADPGSAMRLYTRDGIPQGFVHFTRSEEAGETWEWGFYLAPEAPRGQGRTLGLLALQWAFSALAARRVSARVLENNAPSLALHRALGFTETAQAGGVVCFTLDGADFPY